MISIGTFESQITEACNLQLHELRLAATGKRAEPWIVVRET